ncbi:hypothetical protein JG688_00017220 [Phytophthora aleatoria]|uniref:Uncharacterized protein n=1 Tax=Phytophthora aleatoria TaxID=2496075 RepID=A0A8J5IE78_9STRA|nr:hypothetical protein JG688_00017220 [Phytophthora aleatoria]
MERDLRVRAARDLRAKAAVRPPSRPSSSYEGDSDSLDARSAVNSDEEWVDTGSDASSATSNRGYRSKQGRSEGSSPPRTTINDSSDEGEIVHAAPPSRTQFKSWEDFAEYLDQYQRETYQFCRSFGYGKQQGVRKEQENTRVAVQSVPEEWLHYGKTLICTHGGSISREARARGKGSARGPWSVRHRHELVSVGISWFDLV